MPVGEAPLLAQGVGSSRLWCVVSLGIRESLTRLQLASLGEKGNPWSVHVGRRGWRGHPQSGGVSVETLKSPGCDLWAHGLHSQDLSFSLEFHTFS